MTTTPNRRPAFTLVEMLVVIAIIGVLVALLLPAVNAAINSARRARMALEISQLANAVEAYKNKFGDYPPTFRSHDVFIRHVRKCYPKISATHLTAVERRIWGTSPYNSNPSNYNNVNFEEGEALVFWLAYVDNDPREPFKALTQVNPVSPVKFFDFDQQRLVDADSDLFVSYKPAYAEETSYIYIDSRAYEYHYDTTSTPTHDAAQAEDGGANGAIRAYHTPSTTTTARQYVNPTTFQIICAGQDGNFGTASATTIKIYPTGTGYSPEDQDNLANFSEGRRLMDSIPAE